MKNLLSETELKKRSVKKNYPIRGDYFRDQTAIIHSMPFRRLKHKTQVFFAPENDHVCTRIEHVLHVATVSKTICRGLIKENSELDMELAFAIGLGHDLGHAPFGHVGEEALSNLLKKHGSKEKFIHEVNGYRVAEKLVDKGKGLNLTFAVKDGIISHNGESFESELKPTHKIKDLDLLKDRKHLPSTCEGCIVRFADKISYLGRDIEDAIVADFIKKKDIPTTIKKILHTDIDDINSSIINYLVLDIINFSKDKNYIGFSEEAFNILKELGKFNYDCIYNHKEIIEYKEFGKKILEGLFEYLMDLYIKYGEDFEAYMHTSKKLDTFFGGYIKKMNPFYSQEGKIPIVIVTDYVAGMTDNFALECMKEISIPKPIEFNKRIS